MRRRPHVPPRSEWEVDRVGVNWGPVGHPDISAETQAYQAQLEVVRRLAVDEDDYSLDAKERERRREIAEQAGQDLEKARAAMETAWLTAKPVRPNHDPALHTTRLGFVCLFLTIAGAQFRAKFYPLYWAVMLRRKGVR